MTRSVCGITGVAALVVLGLAAAASPARADDQTIYGDPNQLSAPAGMTEITPISDPLHKLGRGLGNLVTGWLEIPHEIERRYDEQDTASAFFTGLIVGTAKGVVRTLVGAVEVVTFPLPIPEGYGPSLPPIGPAGR